MEHSIGIGGLVGLITASSLYVWNSDEFTKEQKTFLLVAMVFAPVQWVGILVIKYYNNHQFENTPERKTEKKLDSTVSNLTELKEKGILTEEEYITKVEKIDAEKNEQILKNSLEYKQLKSLLDGGILTKEEFDNKIQLLQNVSNQEVDTKETTKIIDSVNKTYIDSTQEKTEEKKESSAPIYAGFILFFLLLIGVIFLFSNNSSNNIEAPPNTVEKLVIDTTAIPYDTTAVYNTSNNNLNNQEAKKEDEKIFVYGTVDYKYFEPEYTNTGYYPVLTKEGKTCSRVFKIKKEELAEFKQTFYSSVDVQHYSNSDASEVLGYATYPETVKVLTFTTMDKANENQMNNCDKVLSTFIYF